MPMLADIDDPPRSRLPGMLWGMAIAAPIAAILAIWFIPALVQAVLGGAENIDERLRMEDQYMMNVCSAALDPDRDEGLCGCVLGTEYPALDCQAPFLTWSVERQVEHCSDEGKKQEALMFCSCVETVAEKMDAAADDTGRSKEAQAYRNCQELSDAVYLPTIDQLMGATPE